MGIRKIFTAASTMAVAVCMHAQTSYIESGNYILNKTTDTGWCDYDWHYEPMTTTDLQRGRLRGAVVKVVSTITDKTESDNVLAVSDTAYYNAQGNLTLVVAPYKDPYNPQQKYQPRRWTYEYDAKGKLTSFTLSKEVETAGGPSPQKHVHTLQYNGRGHIEKDISRAYSKEGNSWEEFGGSDNVHWLFGYDANGRLTSGTGYGSYKTVYNNGRLVSIAPTGGGKPTSFTYDANGNMSGMKTYIIDGYDDEDYYEETAVAFTYNEKGDIIKVVTETWEDTPSWTRKQRASQKTYTIVYTYDAQGNWTKAVLSSVENYEGQVSRKANALTIVRAITYGKQPAPAAANAATSTGGSSAQNGEVYDIVDDLPQFPGGQSALMQYLSENTQYPKEIQEKKIQGIVLVTFIVNTDGSISDTKVLRSVHPALSQEALRVTNSMPKWAPGKKNGTPVRTKFSIPFTFKLPQ